MTRCQGPACDEEVAGGDFCSRHKAQLDALGAWEEEMSSSPS